MQQRDPLILQSVQVPHRFPSFDSLEDLITDFVASPDRQSIAVLDDDFAAELAATPMYVPPPVDTSPSHLGQPGEPRQFTFCRDFMSLNMQFFEESCAPDYGASPMPQPPFFEQACALDHGASLMPQPRLFEQACALDHGASLWPQPPPPTTLPTPSFCCAYGCTELRKRFCANDMCRSHCLLLQKSSKTGCDVHHWDDHGGVARKFRGARRRGAESQRNHQSKILALQTSNAVCVASSSSSTPKVSQSSTTTQFQ